MTGRPLGRRIACGGCIGGGMGLSMVWGLTSSLSSSLASRFTSSSSAILRSTFIPAFAPFAAFAAFPLPLPPVPPTAIPKILFTAFDFVAPPAFGLGDTDDVVVSCSFTSLGLLDPGVPGRASSTSAFTICPSIRSCPEGVAGAVGGDLALLLLLEDLDDDDRLLLLLLLE